MDNLDVNAEKFIAKYRKGSVNREFPGEYLGTPIKEIFEKALQGNARARTAKKLLIDGRFSK